MVDATEDQRKRIEQVMDRYGLYHPDIEAADHLPANLYAGQKRSIIRDIRDTLELVPLREFMVSGVAGADYLVAPKLHSVLVYNSRLTDITPQISMQVVEGDWKGSSLQVQIVSDDNMRPRGVSTGGESRGGAFTVTAATATPVLISKDVAVTGTLIEDSQYDLIEWYYGQAAKAFGYEATERALYVLINAPDGEGTKNSATSATTDTTIVSEVWTALVGNSLDEFVSNTMIITPEAWNHEVGLYPGLAVGTADTYWKPTPLGMQPSPLAPGFHFKFLNVLDSLFSASPQLHDSSDAPGAAFTTCVTTVFDRNNAMLTARKRWLQIENYANPKQDLAGAVISGRQDSVSIYKDSIYVLTEST